MEELNDSTQNRRVVRPHFEIDHIARFMLGLLPTNAVRVDDLLRVLYVTFTFGFARS